jgi:hypothetical protein
MAFEMLEPCDGKLSCTVLRGLGAGNSSRLPDGPTTILVLVAIPYIVVAKFFRIAVGPLLKCGLGAGSLTGHIVKSKLNITF